MAAASTTSSLCQDDNINNFKYDHLTILNYVTDPPYFEKPSSSSRKTVNYKTVSEYICQSDIRKLSLLVFGFLLGILYIILLPICQFISYFLRKLCFKQKKNNYAISKGASEGILHVRHCSKTNRDYTTRFLDTYDDSIDASYLYASGFAIDPLFKYMFPYKDIRHRCSSDWFRMHMDSFICDALVEEWSEKEKLVGIALFTQRNRTYWTDLYDTINLAVFLIPMFFLSPQTALRLFRTFYAFDEIDTKIQQGFNNEISALKYLAVEKGFQGQGIGSNLLESLTIHHDALQIPSYLKSSNNINVPLYERYGYRVFEEHRFTPECPSQYLMVRMPKPKENKESIQKKKEK